MPQADTIVALSSGALPSGVAVIRLSGPRSGALLGEMVGGLPTARRLMLRPIRSGGETIDSGLVAWFPAPHSFTGEDCAELQVHGSRAVVQALLRQLAERSGVRLAEPGEFTRRAFENGKLDLTEVQGLGDLIAAETENQRALAYARLEGGLSRRIEGWRERLLDLRAEIEAQLDFSDEGDVGALPAEFPEMLDGLRQEITAALAQGSRGRIIREGFRVVLAGPPNVGKSSLLNALSHSEAAIVSEEPGTTRDLKEVPLDLGGQLVILTDSAGIRETTSKAEALGVERAEAAMRGADLLLWLEAPDVARADPPEFTEMSEDERPALLRIGTKADIGKTEGADLVVSARTGEGLEELLARLVGQAGLSGVRAGSILVSSEHDRASLQAAAMALAGAAVELGRPEVTAEHLREASHALERLLGRMDAEAVLDRLFLGFCIGK